MCYRGILREAAESMEYALGPDLLSFSRSARTCIYICICICTLRIDEPCAHACRLGSEIILTPFIFSPELETMPRF
jgi:hypothetical protein